MTKYVEETYKKIAQKYTEEFFDDKSDVPLIDKLAAYLQSGSLVLDLGCGPGQFSQHLKQLGLNIEGVDISEQMLSIARRKVPGITFRKMDMRSLNYPSAYFDGILAAYSIIHIPSPELPLVLSEIGRVLKPGGYALFITQEGEPDQILDEPLQAGEKIFMNFFTGERILNLLKDAGFDLVSQDKIMQISEDVLSPVAIGSLVMRP